MEVCEAVLPQLRRHRFPPRCLLADLAAACGPLGGGKLSWLATCNVSRPPPGPPGTWRLGPHRTVVLKTNAHGWGSALNVHELLVLCEFALLGAHAATDAVVSPLGFFWCPDAAPHVRRIGLGYDLLQPDSPAEKARMRSLAYRSSKAWATAFLVLPFVPPMADRRLPRQLESRVLRAAAPRAVFECVWCLTVAAAAYLMYMPDVWYKHFHFVEVWDDTLFVDF